MKARLEMLELLSMADSVGLLDSSDQLKQKITLKQILAFGDMVRDVCLENKAKEINELYTMCLNQATTIKKYIDKYGALE